jgi:hypothetical protein
MNWLSDEMFLVANPIAATITAVEEQQNKWNNTEYVVYVRNNTDNVIFCMSLYKDNLNKLIKAYTDESNNWIGKIILIQQEQLLNGKTKRTITAA